MQIRKSIIAIMLVALMIVAMLPTFVFATTTSGVLDSGATWEYDSATHTLTLGGTCSGSPVPNNTLSDYPWYADAVAGGGIQNYVIGSGINRMYSCVLGYYGGDSSWGESSDYSGVTIYLDSSLDNNNTAEYDMKSYFQNYGARMIVTKDISADDGESNVTVTVDTSTNTITVSGTGASKNYSEQCGPFNYSQAAKLATSIIVEEGVTSLGNSLFDGTSGYRFPTVQSISLPSSLTTIGNAVFRSVGYLNSSSHGIDMLTIPASVTSIGNYAFDSAGINNITNLSESNQTIGSQSFRVYPTSGENVQIFMYSDNTNFYNETNNRISNKDYHYLDVAQTESGTLDNGVTWEYDPATHTLSFDGDGEIPDYDDGEQPWYSAAVAGGGISNYSFGTGITGIGSGTFGYYGGSGAGWGYGGNYSGVGVSAPAGLSGSITSLAPGAGGGGGGGGADPEPVFGDADYEVDEAGEDGETHIILDATPTIFKAQVPIKISVNQAADGTVTVPGTYTIDNLGPSGPIVVTGVSLVMKTGWSIAAYTDDFANKLASSPVLGLQMNGTNFATNGSYTMPSSVSSSILHAGSKTLTFNAKLPAQVTPIENENIAAIVFTLDFDKAV